MSLQRLIAVIAVAIALTGGDLCAQPAGKAYTIGLLFAGPPGGSILGPELERDFTKRGYNVDRNIRFERRAAQGQVARLPELVDELVGKHVDLIITAGFPAALAAKERAPNLPIVVTFSGDPVATGLVASLARPGGNITGVSEVATELSAKRLEILKEAVPSVRKVAVLWNRDDLGMSLRYRAAEMEAPRLGITTLPLGVRAPDDFDAVFFEMTHDPPDAVLMVTDILTVLNRKRVIEFAATHRLPGIFEYASLAHDGGLIAYGPDVGAILDRAADLANRILKGAKPAELPLELPTRFELAINLKTAAALGLTIPESVLVRAGDVIE
jgi:putative tryptophan/tyrosine transport system substrate-binding protein